MTTDITELTQRNELLIANGQQTADLLRHLADNEIDSDYFAVVYECESYGQETDAELSITEFALRAAGYVDALVEALEKAQQENTAGVAGMAWMAESYETTISMLKSRTVELESEVEKWKQESETWEQVAEKQLATAIELESRTVTVKLPPAVSVADWMVDIDVYEADLLRALLTAAGIKVEAE